MGAHGAAKALSKESKLFNKFATRIAERANKIKCGIRNAKDRIAGFARGIKNRVGEVLQPCVYATTPLRDSGYSVSAGFEDHVLKEHFGRDLANSRSVFSITPDELKKYCKVNK